MLELIKYEDQIQFGIMISIHDHGLGRHCHLWIDLGRYCIEITWGKLSRQRS